MFLKPIQGMFALWKPTGISSTAFCAELKLKLLSELGFSNIDKHANIRLGHGGSLELIGSGVLGIGIGNGVKKLWTLRYGHKKYTVKCMLGAETDTYDASGKVTQELKYDHIDQTLMENCIKKHFLGEIRQKPPLYSSVKVEGKRLIDYVSEGLPLPEIPHKTVVSKEVLLTHFSPPHFTLEVSCARQFYVRSLVHDLGRALRSAAHCTEITRLEHGPFTSAMAVKLEDVTLERVIEETYLARHSLDLKTYYPSQEKIQQGNKPKKISQENNFKENMTADKSFEFKKGPT